MKLINSTEHHDEDIYSQVNINNWIFPLSSPDAETTMNIFCFPFVGGVASSYQWIANKVSKDIGVYGIQLPGRGATIDQPFMTSLEDIIKQLMFFIQTWLSKPCIFFGHSLGALIAFELSRRLKLHYQFEPDYLVLSGKKAPQLNNIESIYQLEDDEFIRRLVQYEGTPKAVVEDLELIKFFLPRLKADSKIIDTYTYQHLGELSCPFWVMGGDNDPLARQEELEAWRLMTTNTCHFNSYSGGHFYINSHQDEFITVIHKIKEHIIS